MKAETGFTLIEAMVAGVVSLVIPAVLIAVMAINNRQIGDGASAMRLSQIATAISEDIHRAALAATWVYSSDEQAGAKCPAGDPTLTEEVAGVIFCDANRNILKGYRAVELDENRSTLEEYSVAKAAWGPMVVAGDTVRVTSNPNQYCQKVGKGVFGVWPNGAFLWFNLRLDMIVAGKPLTLPMQSQSVVCRNAPERMDTWPP